MQLLFIPTKPIKYNKTKHIVRMQFRQNNKILTLKSLIFLNFQGNVQR